MSTLNPPPPDFFDAICNQAGKTISCTLGFSDPSIIEEPSEIVCDGTELLYSQERFVVGKRTYSGAGRPHVGCDPDHRRCDESVHTTGRTVLVDSGRAVIDASTDEIVFSAGKHRFDDYFARGDANALAPLCAALV